MKTKVRILYILIIYFLLFNNSYSNWIPVFSSNNAIWDIKFKNNLTGYAVGGYFGDSAIALRTTNGGYNWQQISFNIPVYNYLHGLSFVGPNNIYICGAGNRIFKSTNEGVNWIETFAPIHGNTVYNDMKMTSDSIGYLAGRYGYIVKTTNGGNNWVDIYKANNDATSLYFLNGNTGFVTDASSYLYKTTNAGNNWTEQYILDSNGTAYDLDNIHFINSNIGFMCGITVHTGCVFKTTNSGVTWKAILIKNDNRFYGAHFINENTGFVSAYDRIFKTTNSGNNWSEIIPSNSPQLYHAIYFLNESTGFLGNSSGTLYMSQKGGTNITLTSNQIPQQYNLSQNYPNPFNPSTKIQYQIPKSSFTALKVFDLSGKEITTLVNENHAPGTYETTFEGGNFSSGIYFYRIQAGDFIETKKMMLIK